MGPAWVVTWRLPGDGTEVEHRIWLTFLEAGGEVKIAGTIDEPPGSVQEQQPSWWLGPLSARERDGVTVAGRLRSVTRSLDTTRRSRAHQRPRGAPGRSRELVEWASGNRGARDPA